MNLIDITLEISEEMAIYPGNPSPEISKYREIPEDSTTESKISIGSHTGTHVDAPRHIESNGKTVKDLDLENFYGNAQVLDLTDCKEKVGKKDLEKEVINEEIILLKTDNSLNDYNSFRKDFTYLTLEGVNYLIEKGVKTIGIDYLSLVKYNGGEKAEKAHKKANNNMSVIEGLDLREVRSGNYKFSGMPLKMETDGAPMRAVLIDSQN